MVLRQFSKYGRVWIKYIAANGEEYVKFKYNGKYVEWNMTLNEFMVIL